MGVRGPGIYTRMRASPSRPRLQLRPQGEEPLRERRWLDGAPDNRSCQFDGFTRFGQINVACRGLTSAIPYINRLGCVFLVCSSALSPLYGIVHIGSRAVHRLIGTNSRCRTRTAEEPSRAFSRATNNLIEITPRLSHRLFPISPPEDFPALAAWSWLTFSGR